MISLLADKVHMLLKSFESRLASASVTLLSILFYSAQSLLLDTDDRGIFAHCRYQHVRWLRCQGVSRNYLHRRSLLRNIPCCGMQR